MNIWNNLWRIIVALWGVGNLWARLAIILITVWPFIITLTAFIGWTPLTATVAMLPLLAIFFLLIAAIDPLVIAAIGTLWPTFLKTAVTVIGVELMIGVYFAAVPVENDRGLIPLVLLTILAIIFLVLGGRKVKILTTLMFILTAIFLFGGRDEIKKEWKETRDWVAEQSKPVPAVKQEPQPEEKEVQPPKPLWSVGAFETVSLNKGDTVTTKLWHKKGMIFRVTASKWALFESEKWLTYYRIKPGESQWQGGPSHTPKAFSIIGLHDNTIIEMERVW